jgi:hypothetical protein
MEKEKRKKKVLVKEKVLEMPPVMEELSTVGKSTIRVDAYAKVRGKLQYGGDIDYPGALHGKVLRSPYPMPSSRRSIRKKRRPCQAWWPF